MTTAIFVLVGAIMIGALFAIGWSVLILWHRSQRQPALRGVVFFGGLISVALFVSLAPVLYYVLFMVIARFVG